MIGEIRAYLALVICLTLVKIVAAEYDTSTISCPTLTCSEDLGTGVCFMNSGTNPVEWIKLANCPSNQICDTTQEWAWYDFDKQQI